MLTNFKRVFNFAVNDFNRNKGISVAAVFVLTIAILFVTGLFFLHGVATYLTSQIQSKIDITAYFVTGTQEQDVLNVKEELSKTSLQIKIIEYVSADQALATFKENHRDNSTLIKALEEVGGNPFPPSLNIITNGDPVLYTSVVNILQTSDFSDLISKVIFPKDTIKKIYSITMGINLFGLIFGIILIIVAASVVLSTIKLAIENSKEEISTMRTVGASDWFIRGPFVIQGLFYGAISFLICILLSGLTAYFMSSSVETVLPGFSLFGYFLNWWIFVLIQLGFGMGVGAISALVVVKRHLEV